MFTSCQLWVFILFCFYCSFFRLMNIIVKLIFYSLAKIKHRICMRSVNNTYKWQDWQCGEHLRDRIISLIREVWTHKTNLTPLLFLSACISLFSYSQMHWCREKYQNNNNITRLFTIYIDRRVNRLRNNRG
jgi:hypothetical protein